MNAFFKWIGGWVSAALITTLLGIFFQTQNVVSRLDSIGASTGFLDRLSMTLYDLRYLGSLYIIFVAIALAIAFPLAGSIFKLTKHGRPIIFTAAGAVAILVMLFAMKKAFFDVHLIAGARDGFGIGLQMLAGAIGGFVFSTVSRSKLRQQLP